MRTPHTIGLVICNARSQYDKVRETCEDLSAMNAIAWIVIWGTIALAAALLAGVVAANKNRSSSVWIAWCFVFPPLLLLLWLMPRREGSPPKRRSLDEEDRDDLEGLDIDKSD